ncbi:hypothetical protein E2C01_003666 [Portunus trituberculatus]|uniref:Uncharacterized protein n=1 Tax=Portunus trituberculatus TaxID=210409 RepID=A0A5B7CQS0_PORTR|nr:hypothetical protein [Portunus trituberculatus]
MHHEEEFLHIMILATRHPTPRRLHPTGTPRKSRVTQRRSPLTGVDRIEAGRLSYPISLPPCPRPLILLSPPPHLPHSTLPPLPAVQVECVSASHYSEVDAITVAAHVTFHFSAHVAPPH